MGKRDSLAGIKLDSLITVELGSEGHPARKKVGSAVLLRCYSVDLDLNKDLKGESVCDDLTKYIFNYENDYSAMFS